MFYYITRAIHGDFRAIGGGFRAIRGGFGAIRGAVFIHARRATCGARHRRFPSFRLHPGLDDPHSARSGHGIVVQQGDE